MNDANLTVWYTVKPFYLILKIFGLGPFTVVGDIKDGKIRTRSWDVLYTMLVMGVQVCVLHLNITHDMSLSRTNSILIDIGAQYVEIFNGFNVLFGTCLYAFYRKKIWGMFLKFHEFDCEVN